MTQMTLSMKQKETHRQSKQTYGCQGGGREGLGAGLADADQQIQNR